MGLTARGFQLSSGPPNVWRSSCGGRIPAQGVRLFQGLILRFAQDRRPYSAHAGSRPLAPIHGAHAPARRKTRYRGERSTSGLISHRAALGL